MIRDVRIEDAQEIAEIYNEYILHSTVTFEVEPLTTEAMARRIEEISSSYPYMVYEKDGKVAGYCYVHRWHERAAADGVVEIAVYLSPRFVGQGIGTELMRRMIQECRQRKYRAIISTVTGDNTVSNALHIGLGFEKVAHYKNVGLKFNRLIDLLAYEMIL